MKAAPPHPDRVLDDASHRQGDPTSPARGEVKKEPLRLVHEPQPSDSLEAMRIEGADFGRPAYIKRHHHPVAGCGRRDDPGALGQDGCDLCRVDASLCLKKTVADGNQNGRDREPRGQARNQHHAPHPRKQRGLFGGRFARESVGHFALWNGF